LYLNSEVAASLRVSQANAIIAWMNAGGTLIVGIEQVSDITAAPWLRSVLPADPKEFKTVAAHPELQNWLKSPLDYSSMASFQPSNLPIQPGYPPGPQGRRNRQPQPQATTPTQTASPTAPFSETSDDALFELADLQVLTGTMRDGRA